jgi:hypothetical protein
MYRPKTCCPTARCLVPIRVGKLLTTGLGLSRSAVKGMVDSGRIRLPMAIDARAREDFTLFVVATGPFWGGELVPATPERWPGSRPPNGVPGTRPSLGRWYYGLILIDYQPRG